MNLITLTQLKNYLQITPDQTADDSLLSGLCASSSDFFLLLTDRQSLTPQTYTERINGQGTHSLVPENLPILSVTSLQILGRTIPASGAYNQPGYYFDSDSLYLVGGGVGFPWAPQGIPNRFPPGPGTITLVYSAGFANQAVTAEPVSVPTESPYAAPLLNAATYVGSLTLTYVSTGLPLMQTTGSPGAGQYVISATGTMTFAAADAGAALVANYDVLGIPPAIQQAVIEMAAWAYKNRDRLGITTQAFPQAGLNNSYSQAPMSSAAQLTVKRYRRKIVNW